MSKLIEAWGNDPPRILYLAHPFPDTPDLPLSGSGTADMSVETFLADLQRDYDLQQGHYFAYVMNSDKEEADTYTLSEWEVVGSTKCHEAVIILYYSAVVPYQTVLKYMPALAEDYRHQNLREFVDVESLEKMLASTEL